ncbi:MAG: S8 family serine peptidase [Saprospiraceae bacterium]|nr:S8 family serine peptidase [Saprospiraceae bacterium]MCB9322894.1 S8 family serine peptidase [Lewinellaceae bacterium]
MKRFLIILMTVLFAVPLFSQEIEIPRSYERQIKRQSKKVERFEEKHDVVLDPEATIPLLQTFDNNPSALENWGIKYLEFDQYREKIKAKKDKRKVLIVIFDTAGELKHPSLLKAALKGYSYTGEPLADEHCHATHVAGIMASDFTNIGLLQVLINEGYVKLLPAKILHNQGWGDKPEIIAGVKDILNKVQVYLDNGWLVIFNNSWGGSQLIEELVPLYAEAEKKGIIVCAASGNNGSSQVSNPASIKNVIAVGALQQNEKGEVSRAPYSQYGEALEFVAPGSNIYSTYKNGSFAFLSGTSMGTPEEVACLAITGSYHSQNTPLEIVSHVRKNARDLPPVDKDIFTGYGSTPIGNLLDNIPEKIGDEPDDPEDPGQDSMVIKKERIITLPINDLQMVWGIGSFKDQRPIRVDLVLNITSDRLAEITLDKTLEIANSFFGHTGLSFSDKKADVYDAAEWTARFFHRHANEIQDIYALGIKQITVTDKTGRTFIRYGEDLKISENVRFEDIPILTQLK